MKPAARLDGEHAPGPAMLYVRDAEMDEWHVVSDFGILPPRQTWALCGRWPNRPTGWSEAHSERAGFAIHDICRFWAGIGGPWLYVWSSSPGGWHVIRDTGDGPARVRALCGQKPGAAGWGRSAKKPVGLELHEGCRLRRDLTDLDAGLTETSPASEPGAPDESQN